MKVNLLDRTEFLGDGRKYKINPEDERKVVYDGLKDAMHLTEYEKERILDNAFDSMEDGYNKLECIDGEYFEVYEDNCFKIIRKAYGVEDCENYFLDKEKESNDVNKTMKYFVIENRNIGSIGRPEFLETVLFTGTKKQCFDYEDNKRKEYKDKTMVDCFVVSEEEWKSKHENK